VVSCQLEPVPGSSISRDRRLNTSCAVCCTEAHQTGVSTDDEIGSGVASPPRPRLSRAGYLRYSWLMSAALLELAEDYLMVKRLREDDRQALLGHSDRARRADLARWGRLISMVSGRETRPWEDGLDLELDLGSCSVDELNYDTLVRALSAARSGAFAPATLRRMLSTLRNFTRWLNARGHLRIDPCAEEVFTLPKLLVAPPRSITTEQVEALLAAAGAPPENSRSLWWPVRDRLLISLLAYCGLRAGEACEARLSWIDNRAEHPLLHVMGKGAKPREIPLPRRVVEALDAFAPARAIVVEGSPPDPYLLVRTDGRPLSYQTLDRIVRGLATRSGTPLPAGAAAHSLRHFYGTELALRGVGVSIAAQLLGHSDLKTTMGYQRLASRQLISVLDDAGLL
jgi:integrase/recombinase XerC